MKKTIGLISVTVLGILASLLLVLAGNMFFGDVANISAGMITGLFVTLPAAALTVDVIALFLAVIGYFVSEKTHKKLFKVNLLTIAISSGVGLIGALLAGIVTYHSFTKPYPFPSYLIIFMVLHVLIIAGSVVTLLLYVKKMPEDEKKNKVTVARVFRNIGWWLFVSLALYRFGLFIVSPTFINWRTFDLTAPFYFFMITPFFMLVYKVLVWFKIAKVTTLADKIATCAMVTLTIGLSAAVIVLGINDSTFISAVSPCMPLERLASMPIETFIHIVATLAVGTVLILQSFGIFFKKEEVTE